MSDAPPDEAEAAPSGAAAGADSRSDSGTEASADSGPKDDDRGGSETEQPGEAGAEGQRRGIKEITRSSKDRGALARRYWPFAVLAVATLALLVGLFLAVEGSDTPEQETKGKGGDDPTHETFRDSDAGFSLRYPKAWRRIPVPPEAADLRLVLSAGEPTSDDGLWVRVYPPERIDQKISEFSAELQGTTVLRQEQVSLAGMNGVRYVYTTKDQASGQESVHLQYFLRRHPGKLYVLVFQALPKTDLTGLAPAFDEVLNSFQTFEQPPAPTPTTAAR